VRIWRTVSLPNASFADSYTHLACSLSSCQRPRAFASLFPSPPARAFRRSFSTLARCFFSPSSFRRWLSRAGLSSIICRPFTREV
jgi:hypothetical protein